MRVLVLAALFCSLSVEAAGTAQQQSAFAAKLEQIAEKMMPQKEVDEMLGFFGPVTKKYMPVFQRFNNEYLTGTNKLATVKKYLPKAQSALAEAKAMKIPAKYEAKKADYISKVEAFVNVIKLTALFGN